MRAAFYEQASGLLHLPDGQSFQCYAGRADGRNNPDAQARRGVGPLPRGAYAISMPYRDPVRGPYVFRLQPQPGTEMFGRAGMLIHGDSIDHDASQGCIVACLQARLEIARLELRSLVVVAGSPACAIEKAA